MKGGRETAYTMVFSVLSKVATYFLLLIFANLFLKEVYGRVAFVMSIFNLILIFVLMGVPYILVPWIINKKDSRSVFYFLMLISFVCVVLGIIFSWNHKWVMPLVFLFPFVLIRGFSMAFLNVKYKYHFVSFMELVYAFLSLVFIYSLRNFDKSGIVFGYTIALFLQSVILFFLARKDILFLFKKITFNLIPIKNYISKAFLNSLSYVSFAFLDRVDSFILGFLSTFENVANYNVAGPIANVIILIPFSLGMFLLTKSSEVKDNVNSRSLLSRILRISFSFSFLAAIGIISLAKLIILVFFPKYVGIEPFILILLIGVVFYSLYHLIYVYLLSKLRPEKAFFPIGIAALLNIILDILLVPKFGLYGICFATMISHLVAFTILSVKVRMIKRFSLVYLLVLFLPLAYKMGVYGLLLIILLIPLLIILKLLQKQDLVLISNITKTLFKFNKVKEI
ncbi:MAG: polysaccharide biosynthesis C-terminal domain-containing protein [Nanoarchaeota archaeon]|nr:polysaccharide biosynthesis C-terminal domain-containing protein [Nanoarchaeota archaeon]